MAKAKKAATTHIVLKQLRSLIGKPEVQRLTVRGLGLKRIGHVVEVRDTPAIRGMIEKVQHLVDVQVHEGSIELSGARSRVQVASK